VTPGLAAEDPGVGADRLIQQAVALREQAEQAASAVEALSLLATARARLEEIQQFPASIAAARLVLGDPLSRRRDAAIAAAAPSAQREGEQATATEERTKAPEACVHRFEVIRRGENRCGIGLGEDDRIHLDGRAVGEPIVGWGRPDRLFLSPASSGGQYRIVDACGDMCGRAFVVDLRHNSLRDTFAGRYGPLKDWIFWSPDGAYAALAYKDEGLTWLYVIRASDGTSWEVLNEGLVVRPESLRWLDRGTFEVRAVSCRGGLLACGAAVERGATGDLVRVTLTANGPKVDYR
jgi:hypothetical protein